MIILSQVTWLLNFIPTFTWRHDSVLLSLFSSLNRFFPEEGEALYVDLPGKRASKVPQATVSISILASNICQTGHGPDQRPWDHPDRGRCTLHDSRENLNGATSMARKLNRSSYLEFLALMEVMWLDQERSEEITRPRCLNSTTLSNGIPFRNIGDLHG